MIVEEEKLSYGTFVKTAQAEELEEVTVLSSEYTSDVIQKISRLNSQNKEELLQVDDNQQVKNNINNIDDIELIEEEINSIQKIEEPELQINIQETRKEKKEKIKENIQEQIFYNPENNKSSNAKSLTDSDFIDNITYNWEEQYYKQEKIDEDKQQKRKSKKRKNGDQGQFNIDSLFS